MFNLDIILPMVVLYKKVSRWSGMNKIVKILLVTVFFSILPVANLFALSKEATEAIEAMRARLRQNSNQHVEAITVVSNGNDDEYIPGKELSAALARIRRDRYAAEVKHPIVEPNNNLDTIIVASDNDSEDSDDEESTETIESVETTDQSNNQNIEEQEKEESTFNKGSFLSKLPEKYRKFFKNQNTTPQNYVEVKEEIQEEEKTEEEKTEESSDDTDKLVIIEAREAEDTEAWSIPIVEGTNDSEVSSNVATDGQKGYVPGRLLEQSVHRIKHSRKSNNPASDELDTAIEEYEKRLSNKNSNNSEEVMSKANEEIEELFNNPEKRERIAEEARRKNYYHSNSNAYNEDNSIDDEKFNDYISKYKFKMPDNYRIIVE